jgi:hypothetical protein
MELSIGKDGGGLRDRYYDLRIALQYVQRETIADHFSGRMFELIDDTHPGKKLNLKLSHRGRNLESITQNDR